MKNISTRIILSFLILAPVFTATAIDHYRDPVYFGDYLVDIEETFTKSVKRNGWTLQTNDQGEYFAVILHKTYDIKTQLVIKDKTVRVELISVSRPSCEGRCKVNMNSVNGWLVRLRKLLALDITYAVRNDALRKSAH